MGLWRKQSKQSLESLSRGPSGLDEQRVPLLRRPTEASSSTATEEQRYVQRRINQNPVWTVDRGTGWYSQEREAKKKASLLGSGKHAEKSRIKYEGVAWTRLLKHVWKRDFFTTVVHMRFELMLPAMFLLYFSTFFGWAIVYYVTWSYHPQCFVGIHGFRGAFLFSIETQQTIGYGTHAIGDCWLPAWLVAIHCIVAVILEATFIGILFAKISHPKGRSRTILISECACIARRDGVLKFMFRVADIRKRTVLSPRLRATLYTWPDQYTTREGEHQPVLVQDLVLSYLDHSMLLPVVVEHTVDERSPLYGHTKESLEVAGAEVVVTFEGVSELGDTFMTRRSYLPSEMHWGCMFVNIIHRAEPGHTQHRVDLSRFHDVEPQPSLGLIPPARLSQNVVMGGVRRVPRARLLENTLCLADDMVVCAREGKWFLMARLGDAYPSQMLNVQVRLLLYRYSGAVTPEGEAIPYSVVELPVAPASIMLRYPTIVMHELGRDSPVAHWATLEGLMTDADAEVVLSVTAVIYASSSVASRSKVYPVLGHVRWGCCFAPCVVPPALSDTGHTLVEWRAFHSVVPLEASARKDAKQQQQQHQGQQRQRQRSSSADGDEPGETLSELVQFSRQQSHAPPVRTSTEFLPGPERGMPGCAVAAWLAHHEPEGGVAGAPPAGAAGGVAGSSNRPHGSSWGGGAPVPPRAGPGPRAAANRKASSGGSHHQLPNRAEWLAAAAEAGMVPLAPAAPAASRSGGGGAAGASRSGAAAHAGSAGVGSDDPGGSTPHSPAVTPNTTLSAKQATAASGGSQEARPSFGVLRQWQQEVAAEAERMRQEAAAAQEAAAGSSAGSAAEGGPGGGSGSKQGTEEGASAAVVAGGRAAGPADAATAAAAMAARAAGGVAAPYSLSTASRPVLSNISRSTSNVGGGAGGGGGGPVGGGAGAAAGPGRGT